MSPWQIGLLVALAAVLIWKWQSGRRSPEQLTKAAEALAAGGTLLDVRTAMEFGAGHLDGAKHIAVSDLGRRLGELGKKSKPVVVYCASGARSARAADILRSAGFQTVIDLGPMGNGRRLPRPAHA